MGPDTEGSRDGDPAGEAIMLPVLLGGVGTVRTTRSAHACASSAIATGRPSSGSAPSGITRSASPAADSTSRRTSDADLMICPRRCARRSPRRSSDRSTAWNCYEPWATPSRVCCARGPRPAQSWRRSHHACASSSRDGNRQHRNLPRHATAPARIPCDSGGPLCATSSAQGCRSAWRCN